MLGDRFHELQVSTHKSPRAAEALRRHGCWFLFLPPYSPDPCLSLVLPAGRVNRQATWGECPKLCVSGPAHAGFRYGHALKRSSNMIAN